MQTVFVQRITEHQNMVVITDRMWARLLSSTNQPSFLGHKQIDEARKEQVAQSQLMDDATNIGEGKAGNKDPRKK